ncbi:MAG: carboxypeptidase regulatory-like domain-containing protein, partial [Terracidiphilus sp.]
MTHSIPGTHKRLIALSLSVLVLFFTTSLHAQTNSSKLEGTVTDAQGKALVNATITVKNNATGAVKTTQSDDNGNYSIDGLPAGTYTVEAAYTGFANLTKSNIMLVSGQTLSVALPLNISTVLEEVNVNAGVDSIAAQTAPSGGFIEERSAQSLISNTYIENFTSPVADYGEIVQIVPGTFTVSSDGIGQGQSKTYFRGFPDGDYDIDFDGIPFYDTNTPTHHSWAFFPAQWIGGVDFDRSPGSASTIGPTPFGGSIHLLSKPLTSEQDIRLTFTDGSWNTRLYDAAFNSGSFGLFGRPKKSNLFVDVHHMSSDGYQTFNYQQRSAGSLLYQYQFSPKTVLTGFSGVIHLNANTPGFGGPYRCQTLGPSPTGVYTCNNTTLVNGGPNNYFVGQGTNFLMTNNSDPVNWLDYQYSHYQVYTDFEYVGLKTEFRKGWYLDVKPYTYNYDNGEPYANNTPMTESDTLAAVPGSYVDPKIATATVINAAGTSFTALPTANLAYNGIAVSPCNLMAGTNKKGIAALPCGVDKYNSYRKYGETSVLTQTSKLGVFRTGLWYEWARTSRHQYPSDPLNGWADQPLPNFDEVFYTDSYQPYAEYEWHATKQLNVTGGVKYAGYTFNIMHRA